MYKSAQYMSNKNGFNNRKKREDFNKKNENVRTCTPTPLSLQQLTVKEILYTVLFILCIKVLLVFVGLVERRQKVGGDGTCFKENEE